MEGHLESITITLEALAELSNPVTPAKAWV